MAEELQGLKEVLDKLGRLPESMRPALMQAMDLGIQLVREEAKNNHPPWPDKIFNPDGTWRYHNITTNLTNSINLRIKNERDAIIGEVGVLSERAVGSAMEYASKIERDHPFLGPAVEAKKAAWLKTVNDTVRAFLR